MSVNGTEKVSIAAPKKDLPKAEENTPASGDVLKPKENKPILEGGTYKTDMYYMLGDNSNQTLHTYETRPIEFPGGKISFALGTDYKLDDGDTFKKTVFDVFTTVPLSENFSLRGRVRTNYSSENPTTQFRGGIQFSKDLTDRLSFYTQLYAADKLRYKQRDTSLLTGVYSGLEYRFTDTFKAFAEAQLYDLNHPSKDSVGFNLGLRWNFYVDYGIWLG